MARDWVTGKRFTVMGLGVLGGGTGVARYLAEHGGIVTVTDLRDSTMLQSSIDQLRDLDLRYRLGEHEIADFTSDRADVVVRNPGVPMDSPYLVAARDSGVAIEMEMSIFFRQCPAPIVGITGTKGKSTVSALVGSILRAWDTATLLAGNMGVSAMGELDRITVETPVALELSSFQVEALNDHRLAPRVAVFTNLSPDHLDRYADFDHYADTKRGMAASMQAEDVVVYNADDPEVSRVTTISEARMLSFGLDERTGDSAWLSGNTFKVRFGGTFESYPRPAELALQGDHGARNGLGAVAAVTAYGVPAPAIAAGLSAFSGVPHRLELIATIDGVTYINDTSATAPVASIANLEVVRGMANAIHLIAGGADKQADLNAFADAVVSNGARVYLLEGSATPGLLSLLRERDASIAGEFESMHQAVGAAASDARMGAAVLLSPACASFGMFRNEFDRGDQFRAAVKILEDAQRTVADRQGNQAL